MSTSLIPSLLPGSSPLVSPQFQTSRVEKKTNLVFFLIILCISLVMYFIIQWLSTRNYQSDEKDECKIYEKTWSIIPPGIVTWTVSAVFAYVLFIWIITYFFISRIRYE